ncbi:MAG TPA: HupE/UreJ family protein [Flavisolibacter sp.]|jgi:hydrogenase/urease accessory protein HupE|nr:HupE/UreJ family protein [Flavisolibacter sp.]
MNGSGQKKITALLLLLAASRALFAHSINYNLENAPLHNVVGYYIKLGIEHIVPYGLDHIVFVVGLCLLNTKFKTILWQATAFTVAHSITLVLSMKGLITLPSAIVEPMIALSILFIAIENILLSELKPWRIAIVFLFGLLHGLGFASALNEIGLPPNQFFTSLFSFNVGVEIGQILVIALVFGALIRPFGKKLWYRKGVVYPVSAVIALVALWWTIERV